MKRMKGTTLYATKSNLLDYVTKSDFSEFKENVYSFQDDTSKRFDAIDARLNTIDKRLSSHDKHFVKIERRLDKMDETIRVSIGLMHEQFRDDLHKALEQFQPLLKLIEPKS